MAKPNAVKVVVEPPKPNHDGSYPAGTIEWTIPGSVKEVLLDFVLPPPIYGNHITTVPDRAERTIKLVASLKLISGFLHVTALEGQNYTIPMDNIKYWRNE